MERRNNDESKSGRAGWRGWFERFRGSGPVRTLSTLRQVHGWVHLVCHVFGVEKPWQGDEVWSPVWAVWDGAGPWVHRAVDVLIAVLQLFYG